MLKRVVIFLAALCVAGCVLLWRIYGYQSGFSERIYTTYVGPRSIAAQRV